MRRTLATHSADETERLGASIGTRLRGGDVIALTGDLGAGKTCLTRGIARGMGIDPDVVSSPTFVLIHQYAAPPGCGDLPGPLVHIDLYRLDSPDEFEDIGGEEAFSNDTVCVIEWAERIDALLPDSTLRIAIRLTGEESREFDCAANGSRFDWLNRL